MNNALTTRPDLIKTKRHKFRKLILKAGLAFAILAPLAFIIPALGYKMGIMDLGFSIVTMSQKVGPLLLVLTLLLGVVSLLLGFFIKPRKGLLLAALITLIPLAGLGKLNGVKNKIASLPFIHDITTDTQAPPVFTKAIIDARASTNASNTLNYVGKKDRKNAKGKLVSVLQTQADAYKDIRPVLRSEETDVIFGEALSLVKQQGWDIVTEDVEAGIIEATDTTFWYGFKDDVILRIRPAEGGGTIVDMRSISRVGGSDLGKNAERLRVLIEGLKE